MLVAKGQETAQYGLTVYEVKKNITFNTPNAKSVITEGIEHLSGKLFSTKQN